MSDDLLAHIRTVVERNALVCAVCLYVLDGGKATAALTVIEGYAVCEEHLDAAGPAAFHSAISAANDRRRGASDER